jgi:hypothetical protein
VSRNATDLMRGSDERVREEPPSLLRQNVVWWAFLSWALAFGLATWAVEAALLQVVPDAPPEPWNGVYRLVEAILWVGTLAGIFASAERWPITNLREHWRRLLAQVLLGLALGPLWGIIAYGISPYLMPWWSPRGMWGVVAKEAKGAFFGYGTTAVLAHVILRVLMHRRRAVAAAEALQRAAEARLDLLRVELRPEAMLRAIDGITALVPRDVDAANAALVLLADTLSTAMESARDPELLLADELAGVRALVRLHNVSGSDLTFTSDAEGVEQLAIVPNRLLQRLVEDVVAVASTGHVRAKVALRASRHDDQLRLALTVTSARADLPVLLEGLSASQGASHTEERLRALFGAVGALRWRVDADASSVELTIEVPWRDRRASVSELMSDAHV